MTVTKVTDDEDDGYSLSLDYGKIALVTNGIDDRQIKPEWRIRLRCRQQHQYPAVHSRFKSGPHPADCSC